MFPWEFRIKRQALDGYVLHHGEEHIIQIFGGGQRSVSSLKKYDWSTLVSGKPESTRFRPVVDSIDSVLEEGTGCVRVFEMKGYDHFDFNAAPNNVEYKENAKFEYKILVWCTIPPPGV